jgi:hypothetical protein
MKNIGYPIKNMKSLQDITWKWPDIAIVIFKILSKIHVFRVVKETIKRRLEDVNEV